MARVVLMALGLAGCGFHTNAASTIDAPPADPDGHVAPADGMLVADPSLVQQAKGEAPDSSAPLVITLPQPPAPGHLLVAVGADEHGALTAVTGGGVVAWSLAARQLTNTNIELWYGITNGSSATISLTFPQDDLPMWAVVGEFAGATAFDGAISADGTASPASAGALSVHAHDLVIFGVGDQMPNTFGAPAGGWTALMPASSDHTEQDVWFTVAAATGTLAPSVTETAHQWDAAIAAFRPH